MDKLVIRGGNPLLGTVRISGAKNAALPCMAAALLTDEPVIIENIPQVRDIETTRKLLAAMGAEVELGYGRAHHRTTICARTLAAPEASYELVKTMRASTLVLGPLVARCGRAHVSLPGGCAIGARPIDLHIKGLERLGAKITQEHGYVEAVTDPAKGGRLQGAEIVFDKITVTGTEDLLMAATLAEGETVMQNCAREPEVADLAALLNAMGAKIHGRGHIYDSREGSEQTSRRTASYYPGPHRGGDVHYRGGAHWRRCQCRRMRTGTSHRHSAEAGGNGREDGGEGRLRAGDGRSAARGRRYEHGGISRVSRPTCRRNTWRWPRRRRERRSSPRIFSKTASCTRRSWFAWARTLRSKAGGPWSVAELR